MSICRIWISIVISLLFLCSSVGSSAQVIEIILLLSLLCCLWLAIKNKVSFNVLDCKYKALIYGASTFFVVYSLCYFYSEGLTTKLSALNPYINYLVCAILMLLLLKLPLTLSRKMIFYSVGVAGIFNGVFALYQALILGVGRVYGAIGIFKFSQVSAAICVFTTILYLFSTNTKDKIFYFIATCCSLAVVVLSVTRGSMVGVLVSYIVLCGAIILAPKAYRISALLRMGFLAIFCCGVGIMYFGLIKKVQDPLNIQRFQQDMRSYDEGDVHTSNGLRIEMWKEAIAMFKLSPIFGMHSRLVDQKLEQIIELSQTKRTFNELLSKEEQNPNPNLYPERAKIVKAIDQNRHNQFFDTLASAGLLGILSLFALIGSIIAMFWRDLKSNHIEQFQNAWIGIGVLFMFGGCSIGDVPFSSNFMIPFMMIIFIVLAKLQQQGGICVQSR